MKSKSLLFIVLAYGISWTIWLPLLFLDVNPTLFIVPGGFGPFLSSLVLLLLQGKSIRNWINRILPKIKLKWYILSFIIPILIGLATFFIYSTQEEVNLSLMSPIYAYPLLFLFIFFLGGGQEEPGWRGFLLPELMKEHSAFIASVIVGVVWVLWHSPLFFIPGAPQSGIPFFWYLINTVAISVILTFFYKKTGSVIPSMILHTGLNVLGNYVPFQDGISKVYPVLTLVNWFFVLIFILLERIKYKKF